MVQTEMVCRKLRAVNPALKIETKKIRTSGDIQKDAPLDEIGGKGVFVKDIEKSLLSGEIDLAVHSLKDMQARLSEDLIIAACLEREDPRDMFFSAAGWNFADIPQGARIGTSSLRRKSLLKSRFPEVRLVDIRGNVQTRLSKIGTEVDGVILAAAGIKRLGLAPGFAIPIQEMIPSPGQGIIAIETRREDTDLIDLLQQIDHRQTHICARAERAFLETLGEDCSLPAGAHAVICDDRISICGMLGDMEACKVATLSMEGSEPTIGRELALNLKQRIHAEAKP